MNLGLLRKNVQEALLLWLGCAALIAIFSFFRVWVVGRIDTGRFRQIIALLPKDWERFSAVDFDWIVSYLGRTATTLDEPLLMMLMAGWAMVRGADVVAGELGRGTMEMLLGQPVSRARIFWQAFLVNMLGCLLLALICWAGMAAAVQWTQIKESTPPSLRLPLVQYEIPLPWGEPVEKFVPMREVVSAMSYYPGIVNFFCLGVFLGGLASWISSFDRFGWRALGICVGFFFLQAMIKLASLATPTLAWLGWFTLFSLFEPELHVKFVDENATAMWYWTALHPVRQTMIWGPLTCNAVLFFGGLAFACAGAWWFGRRDLPAPC